MICHGTPAFGMVFLPRDRILVLGIGRLQGCCGCILSSRGYRNCAYYALPRKLASDRQAKPVRFIYALLQYIYENACSGCTPVIPTVPPI